MRYKRPIAAWAAIGVCITGALQLPANATLARQNIGTFASVKLDPTEADTLGDTISTIVGTAYDVLPSEVEIKLEGSDNILLSEEATPASHLIEAIDGDLELTSAAEEDVQEIAYTVAAEHDPSNLPDGVEADTVQNVEVASTSVEVTEDLRDGSRIVEAETLLTKTYETGVVSESLIETVTVLDADGTIVSFKELTAEDYAHQVAVDSGTTAVPYEDEPESSEYGEPIQFSDLPDSSAAPTELEEGSNQASGNFEAATGTFNTTQASFAVGGTLPAKMLAAEKKKVVTYAEKWALKRNPAYRKFDANCTNFLSQAMNAGGWKHVSGLYTSEKAWWYNSLNQSRPWVNAEDWYRFARNHSKRAAVITDLSKVVPGDVIQIKFKGQTRIGHSMVVTKKVGTKVYVSYNTTDRLNKPLSEVLAAYTGETYFAHGI